MNTYRILVTGSRTWDDAETIAIALWSAGIRAGHRRIIIVSGACPRGADILCEERAYRWGWAVERHPADWGRGRRGGPERNRRMVARGANECLAFIRDCSSGATGCAALADAAGIRTLRYPY